MKVFITGGAGFLGSYIVDRLLERGYEVTNYSRGDYPKLSAKGIRCISGDLSDYSTMAQAMKGHDVCFHVASKVAMWGSLEEFKRTNVIGTQNIINACRENGIDKLIYTSTPSVVFGDHGFCGAGEELPYAKNSFSRYGASKALAEEKVLAAASKNFYTVALRPHLIFGPGDQNLIPRLIDSAKKGKLKIVGDGQNQVDVLYVENAADAHLCALDTLLKDPQSISAQAFFLGQGPIKLWEFINDVLKQYGENPISKKVNARLAFKIGGFFEGISKLFGLYHWNPPMTRFVALQLSENHYYNHTKANQLLKWQPKISLKEALGHLT